MTLTIVLTDDEDGVGYVVRCLEIPGCISQGDTIEEALANIGEAISVSQDPPEEG